MARVLMNPEDTGFPPPSWQVYMLRTAAGYLYTGISTEPQRRLREHEQGRVGARSLRGKGPLQLVWSCAAADRAAASRIEYRLKRCSKAAKEALVAGRQSLDQLMNSGTTKA
jgi:putative endonuclease